MKSTLIRGCCNTECVGAQESLDLGLVRWKATLILCAQL